MSTGSLTLRAAVVGARCRRQGIGGHLARFLAEAGCDVAAVAGTTPETAAEASASLVKSTGRAPRPYHDASRMVAEERLDLLVIASPHATHEGYLRLALAAGCHVLCEKPLCWGGADPAPVAESLAAEFAARGLHLAVNCQWPYTLEAYRALYSDALRRAPRTFRMLLSPRSRGAAMLPDALPHALSLLHAVLPDSEATVEVASIREPAADAGSLEISFAYRTAEAVVDCSVLMRTCERAPRPASFAFDGREANRLVELEGYRMRFESPDGRSVPLPDPTPRLVRQVVERIREGLKPRVDPAAVPGMRHLSALCGVRQSA